MPMLPPRPPPHLRLRAPADPVPLPPTPAPAASPDSQADGGVEVRVGRHRWAFPTAVVIAAAMAAGGSAWGVVKAERDDVHDQIATLRGQTGDLRSQLNVSSAKYEAIASQLDRMERAIGDIQNHLMRAPR